MGYMGIWLYYRQGLNMNRGLFQIQEGGIRIKGIPEDLLTWKEMAIVLVIGEKGSGKTTLVNKMREGNGEEAGERGPDVQEVTQSIMALTSPNSKLVIIELSHSFIQNQKNVKSLTFLVLVSSILIYNTKGNITQTNIASLYSFLVKLKATVAESQYQSFPTLFWVLRDFNTSECILQPKEYLEKSLEFQASQEQLNSYKRGIKLLLQDRQCAMLNHPDQKCEYFSFDQQVSMLKQKVLMRAKPIQINNRPMSGELFMVYAKCLMKQFLKPQKLSLREVSREVREAHNQSLIQKYRLEVESTLKGERNQKRTKEHIKGKKGQINEHFVSGLKSILMGSPEDYEIYFSGFLQYIQYQFQTWIRSNEELWHRFYVDVYQRYCEKFLLNLPSVNQLGVRLELVRRQIQQNEQQYEGWEGILESVENKWLKKNVQKIMAGEISRQKQEWEEKYQDVVNCHLRSLEVSETERQQLQQVIQQKLAVIQQLEYKLLEQQEDLASKSYQMMQKQNLNKHLNQKLIQQQSLKNQEINQLGMKITSKQQQINKLYERVQQLEIKLQRKESEERLIQLNFQKAEMNRLKMEESIEDIVGERDRRIETLVKQNNRMEKVNQLCARLKTELREKDSIIQEKESIMKDLGNNKKSTVARLEQRISEYKVHLEEQDEIINSLKKGERSLIEVSEENARIRELLEGYEKSSKVLMEEIERLRKKDMSGQLVGQREGLGYSSGYLKQMTARVNQGSEDSEDESPVSFKIIRTIIKEQNNKPFTLFEIQATSSSNKWTIYKKYKQFCQLHFHIKPLSPSDQLSKSTFIVSPQQLHTIKKPLTSNQRKRHLQTYINDLGKNPLINQSFPFMDFISESKSLNWNLKQNNEQKNNRQVVGQKTKKSSRQKSQKQNIRG